MKQKCDDFTPADQPQPGGTCETWPIPCLKKLVGPTFKSTCDCGNSSPATSDCLDNLIKQQSNEIAAAEKLKPLKAELEAIQAKAKTTSQEYSKEKWDELVETWKERDCCIVQLIQRLLCSLPNWECLIDCYLCPMLHELYAAEKLLGDLSTDRPPDPTNLYDRRYWAERNRSIAQRQLQQVVDVLKVWEKPIVTIEKALADNAKLIQEIEKVIGTGDTKVIFDVFFKLIPRHLAIAPTSADAQTKIDKKYTSFCGFDVGTTDNCCGPNVGRQSLRERLIGPMPYLIQPGDFSTMICCLSQHRYLPAMKNAANAEGLFVEVDEQIKRERARIEKGLKDFEADAKNRLPSKSQTCCQDKEEPTNTQRPKPDDSPCPPKKTATPTRESDYVSPEDDDNTYT